MNITSDPTLPYGLGSFGWDDEGTPAHQVYLIKEGLLVDYLSDRETLLRLGIVLLVPVGVTAGGPCPLFV